MLKSIDWSLVTFVGVSMLKEYWLYYRLPQIYYWESNHDMRENNEQKAA